MSLNAAKIHVPGRTVIGSPHTQTHLRTLVSDLAQNSGQFSSHFHGQVVL